MDSADRDRAYALMDGLDLDTIDFLFIDGWHSVNQRLADWRYVERLSPGGVVVMHDTNVHPGPVARPQRAVDALLGVVRPVDRVMHEPRAVVVPDMVVWIVPVRPDAASVGHSAPSFQRTRNSANKKAIPHQDGLLRPGLLFPRLFIGAHPPRLSPRGATAGFRPRLAGSAPRQNHS